MKAVVAAFNQEKALVGAFSVITNLRMELFQALVTIHPAEAEAPGTQSCPESGWRMWPDCLSSVLSPAAALDTCTAFLRAESKLHTALLMGAGGGLEGG